MSDKPIQVSPGRSYDLAVRQRAELLSRAELGLSVNCPVCSRTAGNGCLSDPPIGIVIHSERLAAARETFGEPT